MDVSSVVLTDAERKAFDKFSQSDKAFLTKDEFKLLIQKKLILDSMNGKSGWFNDLPDYGECKLSPTGKDLKAYRAQQIRIAKKTDRRYWITTGIAIIALLKAFMTEISSGLAWLLRLIGQ